MGHLAINNTGDHETKCFGGCVRCEGVMREL